MNIFEKNYYSKYFLLRNFYKDIFESHITYSIYSYNIFLYIIFFFIFHASNFNFHESWFNPMEWGISDLFNYIIPFYTRQFYLDIVSMRFAIFFTVHFHRRFLFVSFTRCNHCCALAKRITSNALMKQSENTWRFNYSGGPRYEPESEITPLRITRDRFARAIRTFTTCGIMPRRI